MFGGRSPEHEVSIITAVQAMAAMPPGYEIIPLYVTKTGDILSGDMLRSIDAYRNLSQLADTAEHVALPTSPSLHALTPVTQSILRKKPSKPFDVIFPCFHGGVGEGGWIQGLAEFYGVPLVGTGLTGAALGMDKIAMKGIFDGADIKQAPYIWFYRSDWYKKQATFIKEITTHFKFPIFVKPSRGGSSIGTTCANTRVELIRAIDLACAMDTRVVVEQGMTDVREINISVMGNAGYELECSVCEEVFHEGSQFLDFQDKYLPHRQTGSSGGQSQGMASTDRVIPAKLTTTLVQKIETTAKLIFNLFDCSGLVRLDFLVRGKEVYCIEINTIPGSLSFYLWEKSGYRYPELLSHLIELAIEKQTDTKNIQKEFASPILTAVGAGSKLGSKLSSSR